MHCDTLLSLKTNLPSIYLINGVVTHAHFAHNLKVFAFYLSPHQKKLTFPVCQFRICPILKHQNNFRHAQRSPSALKQHSYFLHLTNPFLNSYGMFPKYLKDNIYKSVIRKLYTTNITDMTPETTYEKPVAHRSENLQSW